MNMIKKITTLFLLISVQFALGAADRPNILWITSEDNGMFLGCYGDKNARTPNLDRLAERGIRYTQCYANAPVCAVARSSLILGFPAPTSGMHHMRCKIQLPETLVPYPTLMKRAGYYVTNNAKTDYNTRSFDKDIWDACGNKATYETRAPGQPFFAVFNLEQTHEGQIFDQHYGKPPRNWDVTPKTPAEGIEIPPYQTATPENILDWRRMYDKIAEMDGKVGEILKKLEQSGESENTIVVYCADHGGITLRSKRYLYDSGVHVPMLAAFPPKWQHLAPGKPGTVSDRLVQFIDMPRTFLSLLGVEPPDAMTGRIFLGPETEPAPENVFLYSNRFDEAPDTRRGLTDGRWKLIRNYEPDRPRYQMLFFPWHQLGQPAQWREFEAGKTTPAQSAQFLPQATVELYDTLNDPHEVNNLAGDPASASRLSMMEKQLDEHILAARDLGFFPEPLSAAVDRERGQTIYAYGQSDENYPLPEILAMATLACAQDVKAVSELRKGLKNANPSVRYWAMVGLRALGKDAAPAADQVEEALKDPDTSLRLTAMVCWGNLGHKDEAAQLLLDEARAAKTDEVSLWALDGIKFLCMEDVVKTVPSKEIVKGHYSERTYKFLKAGGNMKHPAPDK
jgi:arylsulfatase A-like enzyme